MTEKKELAVKAAGTDILKYDPAALDIITKNIAPGCDPQELKFLVRQSEEQGMNVIKRECYFVSSNSKNYQTGNWEKKWSIQTSIDFYRKRGMADNDIDFVDCRPFYLNVNKDNMTVECEWHNVHHNNEQRQVLQPPNPDFARCMIKLQSMSKPFEHIAYWDEYVKKNKQGQPQAMWGKMPGLMLCKCAEAGCWRKAKPDKLAGVYIMEEMHQASNAAPAADPPPKKEKKSKPKPAAAPPKAAKPVEAEVTDIEPETPAEGDAKAAGQQIQLELQKAMKSEIDQCQTAEEFNLFMTHRTEDLQRLEPAQYEAVNEYYKKRFAETQKQKKDPPPDAEIPETVVDQVAAEQRDKIQENRKPPVSQRKEFATDGLMRSIMVVCLNHILDEQNEPFIKSEDDCKKFLLFAFKTEKLSEIKYEDAERFRKKFSNGKLADKLLQIYINFQNQP